jgi:hypothetical protein
MKPLSLIVRPVLTILIAAFTIGLTSYAHADAGTRADREALFNDIVEKIMAREAFSPIKNKRLGLSFPENLEVHRDDVINADTDEELYWALVRLSNSRHDKHLDVFAADGGIKSPKSYNRFDPKDYPGIDINRDAPPVAPIRFLPDFSAEPIAYFVSDLGTDTSMIEGGSQIEIGDTVVSVNGSPFASYLEAIAPYRSHSTKENFWMRSAIDMNLKSTVLPESLYGDTLRLDLKKQDGAVYSVSIPYLPGETVSFQGTGEATYPGFEKVLDADSIDTYRSTDGSKILLIYMYGFRDDLLVATDALLAYAKQENVLDHDIVIDATRSRGGGRGAYLVQALSPKPFKTTFGNLRLSDVIAKFTSDRHVDLEQGKEFNDGAPESAGPGRWLCEWLEGDVAAGLAAGQAYSNNVPFKLAHAPEWSDGILRPHETHFTGRMVCWYSPYGGSHLDQFSAITYDNELCTSIGMPVGGYSNTWEWSEVLTFPISGKPVVSFMWNIGHTIRPNGEILEGNPANVNEYIPLTAENHKTYYDQLMVRTREILEQSDNAAPASQTKP